MLEQHNFPSQKQIELLQVLNYALCVKHYPQDICSILDRKIQLLKLSADTPQNNNETDKAKRTLKVTTDALFAILKKAGLVTENDNTKIPKLISYLTNFSAEQIRQRLSNPDELTSYHRPEIENINNIFKELNSNISISYNKHR